MKKPLAIILILAVVAVGLFLVFANRGPSGPALAFELKFKPGQVDKYKVAFNLAMNMPNMPKGAGAGMPSNMKMDVSANMTQKVLSVNPDGSAKVKFTFSNIKANTPFGGPSPASNETSDCTAVIAKDGSIVKIDGAGQFGPSSPSSDMKIVNQMVGIAIPKTPTQVGASWNNHFEIPMIGESVDVQSTLAKDNEPVGKYKTALVTSQVNYKGDIAEIAKKASAKSGMPAGQMPELKGTLSADGTSNCYFDRSAGRVIKSDANAKITVDVEVPKAMAGPSMPNKQHIDMTLTMRMDKVD